MPKVAMGEEMRRAERDRKADEAFLRQLGAYRQVTGKSVTDLAMIVGMSPVTMYSRIKDPGTLRLREYRRIMEEIGKIGGVSA